MDGDLRNCRFDQHILEVAVMVIAARGPSGLGLQVDTPENTRMLTADTFSVHKLLITKYKGTNDW